MPASVEEHIEGSIRVGKLADLVVLVADPTLVDLRTIRGKEPFSKQGLHPHPNLPPSRGKGLICSPLPVLSLSK